MPAALKNIFCDPLNLKADKIQILGEGEQGGSFCPLSKHGLLQKKGVRMGLTAVGKGKREGRLTTGTVLGQIPWVTPWRDMVAFPCEPGAGWCPADQDVH